MKKKIVLFDIDYTLFDTELFRQKLYKSIVEALGTEKEAAAKAQQESIIQVRQESGYFNPEEFSKILAKKLGRVGEEDVILQAIFKKENFKDNYYKEIEDVMKKVSQVARVGIFSKGHDTLQREKLYALWEILSADDIHITINKRLILSDVVEKYRDYSVYVVDDALDILHEIKQRNADIFTVWVKRGFYADKQKSIENFTPDAIIDDLSGLVRLVQ